VVLAHRGDLAGVRFLVTAGGTQEPIDPVRFIANRSSGKMGYAIAREAALRGAEVTLVSGPTWLPEPDRVAVVRVRTTLQMRDAVVDRFGISDVVVQAAAVADFRPADPKATKIKKSSAPAPIELVSNPDIAAELGARKAGQILVGFAAETDDHLASARKKLAEKNLDLLFMNPVESERAGFDSDMNEGVLLGADGSEEAVPLQPKSQIARALCDRIARLRAREGEDR
jgi:phosphopantothenoylcysteine decarboxylase/phosphopantothenate--cysteine ligase